MTKPTLPPDAQPPLIVFDTDCVLCSRSVAFVLAHERDDTLHFVGAWSPTGLALAARYGFSKSDLDETFLFVGPDGVRVKSDAALAILRHLKRPWAWLGVLRLLPRPVRDAGYSLIARHRYRWFGHRPDCVVVPPDRRARFIGLDPPRPD